MIKSVAVVTAQGAELYCIDWDVNGKKVKNIRIDSVFLNGESVDHYCGFDENNKLLFTINPSAPCVVEYL